MFQQNTFTFFRGVPHYKQQQKKVIKVMVTIIWCVQKIVKGDC